MITNAALGNISHIRHAFFTRQGGVSTGIYASLNAGFGSRDEPAAVAENRARAAAMLGAAPDRLITCYQIHSPTCVVVEEPWRRDNMPQADAMVTRVPGIMLGVLHADCAPVLFADREARVIGAAHSGWKGAQSGVLEATLARMVELGADPGRITAAVGPCITQRSYEVGPEFPTPFLDEDPANDAFFVPASRTGHFMFDLPGYIARRLTRAGVGRVEAVGHDTVAEEELFFSYRRATLRGEGDYARGLSAILLPG